MMKTYSDHERNKISLHDMPIEMKVFFILRYIGCFSALAIIVWISVTSELYKAGAFLIAIAVLYLAYLCYLLNAELTGKIIVFEGEYEDATMPIYDIKNPLNKNKLFTVYGKSEIQIKIQDKKFIIPVFHNFTVSSGQSVRVYTLDNGIYEISDNAFSINNPILVKVCKM